MKQLKLLLVLALLAAATRVQAQSPGRVTGTVTNDQGQPVASASVMLRGTRIGTLTGVDGKYVLPGIPAGNQTLTATLIGYGDATKAVTVTSGETVVADFRLAVKAVQLEGIVAVGYGTQQKRTVTGAVSSVTAAQLTQIPTSDPIRAIQGRIAGVDVVQTSNLPGGGVNIRIRGVRSITASNNPLYVVDGVPIAGDISSFNPEDIQSIDVLKDAAATAIYGSRGANGVVLVTTKGAGTGGVRTQFTANATISGQRPYALPVMMNIQQYAQAMIDGAVYNHDIGPECAGTVTPSSPTSCLQGAGMTDQQVVAYQNGQGTDWQKEIERTGVQKTVNLGMNGISGNTRFNLSGSYFDQTGTAVGMDFTRSTGTASVDHTQGRLRLGVTTNFTHALTATALGNGLWGSARQSTGFGLPYNADGTINTHPDGDPLVWNPLKAVQGVRNDVTLDRLFASAFGTFRLLDGVNYRVNFGPDYSHSSTGHYEGPDAIYPGHADRQGSYNQSTTFQYVLDNMLQVNRDLGADHHVDATLLYEITHGKTTGATESAGFIPYDEALYYSLNQGQNYVLGTSLSEQSLQSYMARLVYTFKNRYTVSGAVRRDGASQLAEGHKWVTFPTVGAAWQIGDESFMQNLSWLSSLKLRGSYGVTGNSAISPYQTQGALSRTLYNFGTTTAGGYAPNSSNPANPNLGWEKTDQTDVAADFGLFENRITGSVDWYNQNTQDLLLRRTLPPTSGYSAALQNVGKTNNRGLEVTLSSINLQDWHGLRWQMDVNWAHNANKIVALAVSDTTGCPVNGSPCDLNNAWFVGQPINIAGDAVHTVFYNYKMLGVWQLGEEAQAAQYGSKPGQIKIEDVNGDGQINAHDQEILGNTYPNWTASISNNLSWKGFDLAVLAQIRNGYTIQDAMVTGTQLYGRYGNMVVDYWTPTNPSNANPSPNTKGMTLNYANTRGYISGSHWRINNVQLGYTLPSELSERFGASTARIYATATEPYIGFSRDYIDPNTGGVGAPIFRTLLIGANVSF